MIEVEETESGLHVWDAAKNELSIELIDWEWVGESDEIDRADVELKGCARKLIFPAECFSVNDLESGNWSSYGGRLDDLTLDSGEYVIQIHASIMIYLRFSDTLRIRGISGASQISFEFPCVNQIEIGFRSQFRIPSDKLRISKRPSELAWAISQMSKSMETSSPDRSFPSLREHPPLIEFSKDSKNRREEENIQENNIIFKTPNCYEELFVVAPLAYYLQAEIRVEQRDSVLLTLPTEGFEYEFSQQPKLELEANSMLRKVFMLDCLVRDFGEYHIEIIERKLLEEIGLDGRSLYKQTPEARLVRYLESPFEKIDDKLPDWHLSMNVDPEPSSIETLPYLLDQLSAIYTPKVEILSSQGILEESLMDSLRTSTPENVEINQFLQKAIPNEAAIRGWLSDKVPFDVFISSTQCYQNRHKYERNAGDRTKSIVVILNEQEMAEEFHQVYEIFSDESSHATINLSIQKKVGRDSLKSIVENEQIDFLHYIGHCDPEGLRCPDGNLSFIDIEESNVQTFFLNACGSIKEGLTLVEKGSVVGAVTLRQVLNDDAAKVGAAFARLVINGFEFAKSLELARKQILMSKFYSIIGDGTHRITDGDDPFPSLLEIIPTGNGEFKLVSRMNSPRSAGSCFQPKLDGKGQFRLTGNEWEEIIGYSELIDFLQRANSPVKYEGELYWSNEIHEKLT